jgi:hypothetical protein
LFAGLNYVIKKPAWYEKGIFTCHIVFQYGTGICVALVKLSNARENPVLQGGDIGRRLHRNLQLQLPISSRQVFTSLIHLTKWVKLQENRHFKQ